MNCVKDLRLYPLNSEYKKPLKDFTSSDLFFRMITLLIVWTEGEGARVKVHGQVKGCEIIQDKDGVELNTVVVVMTRSGQFEEHQEATYVLLSDG